MPRPAKEAAALKGHKTKAELEARAAAEEGLKTGTALCERKEVKENAQAHKEFIRVKKLFAALGKDDGIYAAVVNRYCLIQAECLDFEEKISSINGRLARLENDYDADKIEADFYYKTYDSLQKSITSYDRQIMTKRKMLFDIEKENLMTVASGLRSAPKTPPQKEENPLIKALMDEDG